mgnify:CR=1 FL=1
MSQIKISVPNDDHVALRAMAKALEEIAVARGAPLQSKQVGELNYKINIDTTDATAALEEMVKQVEPQPVSEDYELRQEELRKKHIETVTTPFIDTDSTGTPWDERIHSASKALNSDGTWRVRRKPKDMDEGEWTDFIEQVTNELKWDSRQLGASEEHVKVVEEETLAQVQELINKPAAPTDALKQLLSRAEPPVTPAGDDFHVDAGEVTEQEVASIPAPPPPPVVAPAVPAPVSDESYTFPQVMQFLTERHGRITSPQVDQIIADMGLDSIMDIRDNPAHAGPFIARVKALLGV